MAVAVFKVTSAHWLSSRDPAPPQALLQRMLDELGNLELSESAISPKLFADAGASILKSLDTEGCNDRDSALDLLAADALFTYAIEAAAESSNEIVETSRYLLEKVTSR